MRLSSLGFCILAAGCATASGGHEGLPAAQSECHVEGITTARLRAKVIDNNGDGLPGIPVVATLIDRVTPRPLLERTALAGSDGWAVMEVPGGHTYQVLVRQPGFVPRSGVLFLGAGCRTEMFIELTARKPRE